jgi:hypothetical protein
VKDGLTKRKEEKDKRPILFTSTQIAPPEIVSNNFDCTIKFFN